MGVIDYNAKIVQETGFYWVLLTMVAMVGLFFQGVLHRKRKSCIFAVRIIPKKQNIR